MDATVLGIIVAGELVRLARDRMLENAPTGDTDPQVREDYEAMLRVLDADNADLEARVASNRQRAGLAP